MIFLWLAIALLVAFGAAGTLLGLMVMFLISALVGYAANALVPGHPLQGGLAVAGAGLVGSALGVAWIGPIGPHLGGVAVLPALIGSVMITLGLAAVRSIW